MKYLSLLSLILVTLILISCQRNNKSKTKPNILIAIADDQSYPHTGIYGFSEIKTPAFDYVARNGVLFNNAFVAAPGCSPSRAAMLTGKNIWQLEEAGTHASNFPLKFDVYTEILKEKGFHVGYTGKPWGPGNWKISGRKENPAGKEYNKHLLENPPTNGIRPNDYQKNFKDFLAHRDNGQPFVFWFGAHEPHRVYEYGSGLRAGKSIKDVEVPEFFPDTEIVRNDMLDYILEIEHFDSHLLRMIKHLEEIGELDNTFILVTADNGMPFPYAKANVQEYGTHVPLAISLPGGVKNKVENQPVGLIDLAPTLMELMGISAAMETTGKSLIPVLKNKERIKHRDYVLTGRERHTHARPNNLGYPARAIRSEEFLLVYNFFPDLWPAGNPVIKNEENDKRDNVKGFKSIYPGYHDIDPSPTKEEMMGMKDDITFDLAFSKRPMMQLYDVKKDPFCMNNIAKLPEYREILSKLNDELFKRLKKQGDPRVLGNTIFDSYPRYSTMRNFTGFNDRGTYNSDY